MSSFATPAGIQNHFTSCCLSDRRQAAAAFVRAGPGGNLHPAAVAAVLSGELWNVPL